jgi:hypothetical protein
MFTRASDLCPESSLPAAIGGSKDAAGRHVGSVVMGRATRRRAEGLWAALPA